MHALHGAALLAPRQLASEDAGLLDGGALGTFGPGQMVPAFDKVCWTAPVGEVQGPVDTQFGSHLILVTERDDGAKAE